MRKNIKKAENFKQKLMEQIEIYDEERIKNKRTNWQK